MVCTDLARKQLGPSKSGYPVFFPTDQRNNGEVMKLMKFLGLPEGHPATLAFSGQVIIV